MLRCFAIGINSVVFKIFLQVFAVGTPNPYRLRAFVSAKVPTNGTFSQYINMYNPYSKPLQVHKPIISSWDEFLFPIIMSFNVDFSIINTIIIGFP